MEEKNKCVRAECSRILWAVLTILLCAAPSLRAVIIDDGEEHNIDYKIENDYLQVDNATVNLLAGAYVDWYVTANAGSTVNIKGGQVVMWVSVGLDANVTVYGTDFKVDGVPVPYGSMFIGSKELTGSYENGDPISLVIDCYSEIGGDYATINLAAPGVGPQPVDIDIKPGSYPNAINLGSNGVIPVAILSSDTFKATTVDPETVFLAGAGVAVRGKGNKLASQEDVNGDGLTDLVVKLETENLDPDTFQNGTAILTGETYDGVSIEGEDEITIVPPA